mmetsp:Transcript_8899/g.16044  ORF Transcript_8899/g.16044 Transcript_8899/m.16044 type:complete len:162 (-) Transcript_8899:944-1429(-)
MEFQNEPAAVMNGNGGMTSASVRSRTPGTKACPDCRSVIAAARAKCQHCQHVFRERKVKAPRSGKRGKKLCPKCSYENPAASSSCKSCSFVFRLKIQEKFKRESGKSQSLPTMHGLTMHHMQQMHPHPHASMSHTGAPMPQSIPQMNEAPPGMYMPPTFQM